MSRIHSLYTSFNNGVITPFAEGRVRLSKYKSSAVTLNNMLPTIYGGVTRRPGFQYIAELEDSAKHSILLPFEYSDTSSYVLEMNDENFRVYKGTGQILKSSPITDGDFSSGISDWTDNSAGSSSISHTGSALRLTQVSTDKAQASILIEKAGICTYTVTLDVATNDIKVNVGTTIGGTDVHTETVSTGTSQTVTFTPAGALSTYDLYLTLESTTAGNADIDNISLSTPIYKAYHPYDHEDLADIRYAQSNDVIYLVHQDYKPQKLIRYGEDKWTIEEVSFFDGPYLDEQQSITDDLLVQDNPNITISMSGTSGSVTATASADLFKSTDVGRLIRFKATVDNTEETSYSGNGTQTYFDIPFYPRTEDDIEVFVVSSTGQRVAKTGGGTDYTISNGQVVMGTAPTSSELLIIRRENAGSGTWGWGTITAYSSATSVTVTTTEDFDEASIASTNWRLGAWSDTGGYPSTVIFHGQRAVFAGTPVQSQTFWASKSYDFEDFSPDNALNQGDVSDDTAYTYTVASFKSDDIVWLASVRSLLIGTSNNIYSVTGGSSGAITASNVNINKESSIGSLGHAPAQTDNQVLMIKKLGREVNAVGYKFEVDGYTATNTSLLSEHLGTESNFRQIVFQEVPSKIFWVRRADGTLVSLTYQPDQDVVGWATHEIGGTAVSVEHITSIPSTTEDRLYAIISRTIDGSTVKYVEMLTSVFNQTDKEDAKFLDSLLTYSGSATTTITGLDHLEGETLSVLADGAVHPDVTVSSGSITLNYEAEKVQLGLGYTSELETVNVEAGIPYGVTQMTIQRVLEASIKFTETLGCRFGYSSANTDTLIFRTSTDTMDNSPPLFTGVKTVKFPHGHETASKIYIKQDQPLPMHILSILLKIEVTDR